jgi:hypothetical protein
MGEGATGVRGRGAPVGSGAARRPSLGSVGRKPSPGHLRRLRHGDTGPYLRPGTGPLGGLTEQIADVDEIACNVHEADDPIAKMVERQRLNPAPPAVSPDPVKD